MKNLSVKISKGRQLKALFSPGVQGKQGLQGEKGEQGVTGVPGLNGNNGIDGKSAYEIALESGFIGTEAEWITSLKGDKGDTGEQGVQGIQGEAGLQGEKGEQGIKGDTGEQGIQGIKGDKGDKGDAGEQGVAGPNLVSVTTASNINGILKGNGEHITAAIAGVDYAKPFVLLTQAEYEELTIIDNTTLYCILG